MSAGTSFPAVWFLPAVTPLTRRLLVYFDSGAYTTSRPRPSHAPTPSIPRLNAAPATPQCVHNCADDLERRSNDAPTLPTLLHLLRTDGVSATPRPSQTM